MKTHPLILRESGPSVVITELSDSSINLQLSAWAKTGDMGTVKNYLITGIFDAYTKEGIELPFPQLDVNIKQIAAEDAGKPILEKI